MLKIIHLVKRKSHLSHSEFREHFERSHASLVQKHCGHLLAEYRRNYVDGVLAGDPRQPGEAFGPVEWDWDLISEWTLPDADSFDELTRILERPAVSRLFEEDEDLFIDRRAGRLIPCSVQDTGPGGDYQVAWRALDLGQKSDKPVKLEERAADARIASA